MSAETPKTLANFPLVLKGEEKIAFLRKSQQEYQLDIVTKKGANRRSYDKDIVISSLPKDLEQVSLAVWRAGEVVVIPVNGGLSIDKVADVYPDKNELQNEFSEIAFLKAIAQGVLILPHSDAMEAHAIVAIDHPDDIHHKVIAVVPPTDASNGVTQLEVISKTVLSLLMQADNEIKHMHRSGEVPMDYLTAAISVLGFAQQLKYSFSPQQLIADIKSQSWNTVHKVATAMYAAARRNPLVQLYEVQRNDHPVPVQEKAGDVVEPTRPTERIKIAMKAKDTLRIDSFSQLMVTTHEGDDVEMSIEDSQGTTKTPGSETISLSTGTIKIDFREPLTEKEKLVVRVPGKYSTTEEKIVITTRGTNIELSEVGSNVFIEGSASTVTYKGRKNIQHKLDSRGRIIETPMMACPEVRINAQTVVAKNFNKIIVDANIITVSEGEQAQITTENATRITADRVKLVKCRNVKVLNAVASKIDAMDIQDIQTKNCTIDVRSITRYLDAVNTDGIARYISGAQINRSNITIVK